MVENSPVNTYFVLLFYIEKMVPKKISTTEISSENNLLEELFVLIEDGQASVVSQTNSTLIMLFWRVGQRINHSILQNKRADYGQEIVATVS
jgi:hypothetical protein